MCAFCTSLHGTLESDVIFEGKDNYLVSVVCQAHDLLYMLFGLLYLSISFGCMVLDDTYDEFGIHLSSFA